MRTLFKKKKKKNSKKFCRFENFLSFSECLCTQSVCHGAGGGLREPVVHKPHPPHLMAILSSSAGFVNTSVAMGAAEGKQLLFLRLSILHPSSPDLPSTPSCIPHGLECLVCVGYAGLGRS